MILLSSLLGWFFNHSQLKSDLQTLKHRRHAFENHLLSLYGIIRRSTASWTGPLATDSPNWLDTRTKMAVITDFNNVRISSMISSCPPSLLAYIREWQEVAHVLACINIAISYISLAVTQDTDPLTDRICNTMVATILSFPVPEVDKPAQPRPDDAERLTARRVFTEEPQMKALMAELDEVSRVELDEAADRVRARLPLLPAFFEHLEPEKRVD